MAVSEILTKVTETSREYTKPDGSKRLVIAVAPIAYEKDGQFRPIDSTIVLPDGVVWSTVDTPYIISWDVSTFTLDYESKRAGRVRVRLAALDGKPFEPVKGQGAVQGRKIVANATPSLRIDLAVFPKGVEIFKVLLDETAPKSLMWEVTEPVDNAIRVDLMGTTGWDNALHLVDRRGQFAIRRPIEMVHEMGPESVTRTTRTYTVTETFTGRTRVVSEKTMARSWVEEVAYPVMIDVTVNESVGANADDGRGMSPAYWIQSHTGTKSTTAGAFRFQTVDVPQGATINSATLTLNVTFRGGSGSAVLKGQNVDDAPSWANYSANSPLTMSATTASLNYSVPATTGSKNLDVTSIVQEIVNRAGWTNNNDLRLGFSDISAMTGGSYMYFEDYIDAGTAQAALSIDYTAGGATGQPTMRRFGGVPGMTPGPQSFGRGW